MKKVILVLVTVVTIISCGSDKKKEEVEKTKPATKYSLVVDAIYEKDDSLVVFYEMDGIMQYEKPISYSIKGSPMPQNIKVDMPVGIIVENIKIEASTNKSQDALTVKNISVLKDGAIVIDGSNGKYPEYFLTDESFTWDLEKSRYKLNHSNKYSPGLLGSQQAMSLLGN